MKIAVLCSLVVIFFLSVQLCSVAGQRRKTKFDWGRGRNDRINDGHSANLNYLGAGNNYKGNQRNTNINHKPMFSSPAERRSKTMFNLGRHSANFNNQGVDYNYKGNRWNTNINHNFFSKQTSLDANYRRNHNFNVGYNSQNRQTNVGYQYNFGRRRRSVEGTEEMDLFKPENDPKVFLEKLASLVDEFVKDHRTTVPALQTLSVTRVNDLTFNVTVAKEAVCLVRNLQRILPRNLGNFIVKMVKFHGPSYNIDSLGDFFYVDSENENEGEDEFEAEETCKLPEIKSELEPIQIESAELLEIKKFVASLVKVAMEYHATTAGRKVKKAINLS